MSSKRILIALTGYFLFMGWVTLMARLHPILTCVYENPWICQ